MPRDFRDEMPSLVRSLMDWASDGLAGWSKAAPVMAWVVVGGVLLLASPLFAAGHGLAAVYRHLAPRVDVVTLRRRA